jgi:hypothetical protein
VLNVCASIGENATEQVVAVTALRLLFKADKCDPVVLGFVFDSSERFQEPPLFADRTIEGIAFVVVELFSLGALSKMFAEPQVLDSPLLKRGRQNLAIEMRGVPRPGPGANIYDEGNLITAQ